MHKIFSYGTLKDKFPQELKEATLEANYEMDSAGMFPMLRPCRDYAPQRFEGCILELTDSQFTEADRYEGYPDLYDRVQMNVKYKGELVKVWVYVSGERK